MQYLSNITIINFKYFTSFFNEGMMNILPVSNGDLNGIITRKIINYEVVVSSTHVGSYFIEGLFDRDSSKWWCSKNDPWSFIQLNFNFFGILLTNYTVKAGPWIPDSNYPKQWIVSGFDGEVWENISTVTESNVNVSNKVQTFQSEKTNVFFSSIRFTMTNRTYYSIEQYHFCVDELELFGFIGKANHILFDFSSSNQCSCMYISNYLLFLLASK